MKRTCDFGVWRCKVWYRWSESHLCYVAREITRCTQLMSTVKEISFYDHIAIARAKRLLHEIGTWPPNFQKTMCTMVREFEWLVCTQLLPTSWCEHSYGVTPARGCVIHTCKPSWKWGGSNFLIPKQCSLRESKMLHNTQGRCRHRNVELPETNSPPWKNSSALYWRRERFPLLPFRQMGRRDTICRKEIKLRKQKNKAWVFVCGQCLLCDLQYYVKHVVGEELWSG